MDACSSYLDSQLELDNCVDIATIADTYTLPHLCKRAYCFMACHLDKLACLCEFQRLTFNQLEHLLSKDFPIECLEYDVFHALLCWVHYDMSGRVKHALPLLSHIRFADISDKDLETLWGLTIYKDLEIKCSGLRTFITGARFVSLKVNKETPSKSKGLVNLRGLEPTIVNVGGFQSSTGMTNRLTYFSLNTNKWRQLTSIPHVEQCNFGLAVMNNELYVVGGCFNQSLQETPVHPFGFKYSPRNDKWTSITPLLHDRGGFYLGSVGEKLYAIGGIEEQDIPHDSTACERYDPNTNKWSEIVAMPGCRKQNAGATYGNEIFISGGLDWDVVLASFICYNVDNNTWNILSPMPTPRADHCMAAHEGKLYVGGGWFEDNNSGNRILVHSLDCYDLVTDQWEAVTHVPSPRYLASLTVLEDTLYLIGGFDQSGFHKATKKIDSYDITKKCWKVEQSYPVEIWEHLSCILHIPTCRDDEEVQQPYTKESSC